MPVRLVGPAAEIAEFQTSVAREWIRRAAALQCGGDSPEARADHAYFQFMAYFGALNALYWLWGLLEGAQAFSGDERTAVRVALEAAGVEKELRNRVTSLLNGMRGESRLLASLTQRLHPETASRIVDRNQTAIGYLSDRPPVLRMSERSLDDSVGSDAECERYRKRLADPTRSKMEQLQALTGILYQVRCNLVHGSKVSDALDRDLVQNCVPVLRDLANACLEYTQHHR